MKYLPTKTLKRRHEIIIAKEAKLNRELNNKILDKFRVEEIDFELNELKEKRQSVETELATRPERDAKIEAGRKELMKMSKYIGKYDFRTEFEEFKQLLDIRKTAEKRLSEKGINPRSYNGKKLLKNENKAVTKKSNHIHKLTKEYAAKQAEYFKSA